MYGHNGNRPILWPRRTPAIGLRHHNPRQLSRTPKIDLLKRLDTIRQLEAGGGIVMEKVLSLEILMHNFENDRSLDCLGSLIRAVSFDRYARALLIDQIEDLKNKIRAHPEKLLDLKTLERLNGEVQRDYIASLGDGIKFPGYKVLAGRGYFPNQISKHLRLIIRLLANCLGGCEIKTVPLTVLLDHGSHFSSSEKRPPLATIKNLIARSPRALGEEEEILLDDRYLRLFREAVEKAGQIIPKRILTYEALKTINVQVLAEFRRQALKDQNQA